MSSHILSLFGLFRRRKTIDQIVSPMNKILKDLSAYAADQHAQAEKANQRIADLAAQAHSNRSEATAALALASNYQTLITPKV